MNAKDIQNARYLNANGISIDLLNEVVSVDGHIVHLAHTGFRLLRELMARPQVLCSKDDLIDSVWSGRIVSDAVLTTTMKEVRSAIKDSPRRPRFISTVHGRGYRFVKSVKVVFAEQPGPTVSTLAPEGVEAAGRTEPAGRPEAPVGDTESLPWPATDSSRPSGGARFMKIAPAAIYASLLVLIGLLIGFAPGRLGPAMSTAPIANASSAPQIPGNAIAVLPFESVSLDPADAAFTNGIYHDLLNRLANVESLAVASRTSSARFRNVEKSIPEIAAELQVDMIVEGSVTRFGDMLHLNLQLVDGVSDRPVWAETYEFDRSADDAFAEQSEKLRSIAHKMRTVVDISDDVMSLRPPTTNMAAYHAYVQGKILFENAMVSDWQARSLEALDEAINLDPFFAEALAYRARVELSFYWYSGQDKEFWVARAGKSIDRAVALAPETPATLVAQGYYHYWGFLDFAKAEKFVHAALQLAPNNWKVWELKAYIARRRGDFGAALEALATAHRLEPMNFELTTEHAETLAPLGRFDEAQRMIDRARAINPLSTDLLTNAAAVWRLRGEPQKAFEEITKQVVGANARYYRRIFEYALLTREPANIQWALDQWPEAHRSNKNDIDLYRLSQAEALLASGRRLEGEAIIAEIYAKALAGEGGLRIGWKPNGAITPVYLPSLLGDSEAVHAVAEAYLAAPPNDAWAQVAHIAAIARAFARVGDAAATFECLAEIADRFGPQIFLAASVEPAFDHLRDDPRYQSMEQDYRQWVDAGGPQIGL